MFNHKLNHSQPVYHYVDQELNMRIIESINTHNYERLKDLLQKNTGELIIINAIYATMHLIITDSYISREILFNAHHNKQINIPHLTALTYLPELEESKNGYKNVYKSKSILNAILEYCTKYKLLMIDIKNLYLLINQRDILNMFLIMEYIIPKLPIEYNQIFMDVFLKKNPNILEVIYKELQGIFANKLYISVKAILDSNNQISNNTLSILDQQLSSDIFQQHHDLLNILTKTLKLLKTYANGHSQERQLFSLKSPDYNQEFLLFLYSQYGLEDILPNWSEEPIENSRLFSLYRHYNNI